MAILGVKDASLFENGFHPWSLHENDVTEDYFSHLNKKTDIVIFCCKNANIRSQERYIREINNEPENCSVASSIGGEVTRVFWNKI